MKRGRELQGYSARGKLATPAGYTTATWEPSPLTTSSFCKSLILYGILSVRGQLRVILLYGFENQKNLRKPLKILLCFFELQQQKILI